MRVQKFAKCLGFDRAERWFAFVGDQLSGGASVQGGDFVVEVDERKIESCGECACDFRFTASHETDDDDWSFELHLSTNESSNSKNSGKETAAASERRISVSPRAMSAATEKAIAIR